MQLLYSHHEATHAKMNVIIIHLQRSSQEEETSRQVDGWMDGWIPLLLLWLCSSTCASFAAAADLSVPKNSVSSTKTSSRFRIWDFFARSLCLPVQGLRVSPGGSRALLRLHSSNCFVLRLLFIVCFRIQWLLQVTTAHYRDQAVTIAVSDV